MVCGAGLSCDAANGRLRAPPNCITPPHAASLAHHIAALENVLDTFALPGQYADIPERISVHHKYVSNRTRLDGAKLAFQIDNVCSDRGGRTQCFEIAEHLGANSQLVALERVHLAKQVRTETHRHTRISVNLQ